MPVYEYECAKCGHEFEREQRMSDAPVKTCPKCKGRKVTKLISRSSFVLKGGGWYADGYSNNDSGKSKDKDKDSKSEGSGDASDSGSKSDGKSSEKSDTSKSDKSKSDSKSKSKGKTGSSKSAS
jgi:putative FmdB family regulatory protein